MANKCKKDFKKVGGRCVGKKTFKIFGNFADEVDIFKVALIASILGVGGWLMFSGLLNIFGLDNLNGWIKLVVGFIIIFVLTKIGINKK